MNTHLDQLRRVIEQLMSARPKEAPMYRALRKILERDALTFTWVEYEGRPIKIWSTKGYDGVKHLAADIQDDTQAALFLLFVEGSLVFTTDIDPTSDIKFRRARRGLRCRTH
jgi:DNA-binding PadR family transcriptional regulator